MDISTRKMALIQWLIDLKDVSMITHLEDLSSNSFSNELTQREMEGLDHALAQIEEGKVIPGEEVQKRLKAKYNL